QEREFYRVGGNTTIKVNVRFIAATNKNLEQMVKERSFREDLYYRLNVLPVHIPPLRERKEDIPALVEHFLNIYSKKYNRQTKSVSLATYSKLEKYYWPGNIRELQHAIERAVIMGEAQVLQPADFNLSTRETQDNAIYFDDLNLEIVEKIVVQKAIVKHVGNISNAAKELGLTRASLYRRMEKYGI
ncbi:MAG: sigma-54-dependent Fis family transcriptional regulator, partial [Calditrichia bacterium]|nr:sigma-54-dependent Fis family transcriptional regulator [Calditrichia bacterium]